MVLRRRIYAILIIVVCVASFGLIAVAGFTYAYYFPTVINKQALINHNDIGLTLLDNRGREFFSFYDAKNKKYVPLSSVSTYVKKGVVASEDDEFYIHHGYSYRGIIRSIVRNFSSGSINYGGSTITQQLVKNTLLSPDRNFVRKFKEIILAIEIEQIYSKEQILEMYLNTSYFGENAFGIENAAQTYFGKNAKELSLSESSYLIALLPAPTSLSENLKEARIRQKFVLERMAKENVISPENEQVASETDLVFGNKDSDINIIAPHFALFVRDTLIDKYGERKVINSGFRVKTTLSTQLQNEAEDAVASQIKKIEYQGAGNGAAVVMQPSTGYVLAMVGSRGWEDANVGKINMAVAPRQPGSSFKPFVYALALGDQTITAASTLHDKPTTFKMLGCTVDCEYKPQNYDKKYRGNVTTRRALANSLNVPAVEVMQKVGVSQVLAKAPQIGIKSLGSDSSNYGLSLVLGTGEVSLLSMTNAYATFANEGKAVSPVYITQITDKKGNKQSYGSAASGNPWTPEVAYIISSILSDNGARQEMFGNALTISRTAAVKTGTSENYRDAWTIGYTPDVVVGVWVGNNDAKPMNRIAGSLGAAPIWRQLMEYFHRGLAVRNFSPPQGVVKIAACFKAEEATISARITSEYFIKGTEPSRHCFSLPRSIAHSEASSSASTQPAAQPSPNPDSLPAEVKIESIELVNKSEDSEPQKDKDNNKNRGNN